ncbi:hypothetical protein, partial [Burkholderia thailandensis]|uniref:hypothetical protein n=1 Tax=Burkholderia thailandensis TaxID=57975 RepID=UPI001C101B3A
PPDIHKIRRQVTQSFSKAPRFSAMNLKKTEPRRSFRPPPAIRQRRVMGRPYENTWRVGDHDANLNGKRADLIEAK